MGCQNLKHLHFYVTLTLFEMKSESLDEVRQMSLCSIYLYLLANYGTVNHEYRSCLDQRGVCHTLPKDNSVKQL